MRNLYRYGGLVASIVLIAFGAGAIYTGIDGRARVGNDLAREKIVGTPDSHDPGPARRHGRRGAGVRERDPQAHARGHGRQDLRGDAALPDESGQGTNDEAAAAKDPKTGEPVANGARNLWVTSTALQTALQTAYFAEGVATFAIVMGVALLLSGIGFLILTLRVLPRSRGRAARRGRPGGHRLGAEQPVVERVADELGPGAAAELLLDVRAVGLHRAHAQVELPGDLRVGVAERDQPQDLQLALGQVVRRARRRAVASRAPSRGLR